MKRGDLVTIALQGDFGKPRPALVVQNDEIDDTRNVLVCPLTSTAGPYLMLRFGVEPSESNGLRQTSFVMLSNIVAAPRAKCGAVIGQLTTEQMTAIDARLAFVLGLG
jgi:mRNA interferase MazF